MELKWALDAILKPLLSGHPGNMDSYAILRVSLLHLVKGDVDYDAQGRPVAKDAGGSAPMQVGGVDAGKSCGKGKHKNKKP